MRRLGMLVALALTLAPGFWAPEAHAGTLAQRQLQKSRTVRRAPRMDLCVGGARTATCRAALDSVLRASAQMDSLPARPAQHGFYSSARLQGTSESHEPLPVKFNTDPEWKKRAIVMAHEGLTFLRMLHGANRELVVGSNRHGMLGFSLKDTTGE